MMYQKILSVVLSCALTLSLVPVSALGDEPESGEGVEAVSIEEAVEPEGEGVAREVAEASGEKPAGEQVKDVEEGAVGAVSVQTGENDSAPSGDDLGSIEEEIDAPVFQETADDAVQDSILVAQNEAEVAGSADGQLSPSMTAASQVVSSICGTCEWSIDDDGNLVVWPINGYYGELTESCPWWDYRYMIRTVSFEPGVEATDCHGMFEDCASLEYIELDDLDTRRVEDMSFMFHNCSSLTGVTISSIDNSRDLSSVTTMKQMFAGCSSLGSASLSYANALSLEDASGMFDGCTALYSVDLESWYIPNVTDMSRFFAGCTSLGYVDLSTINADSLANIAYMFAGCTSLTSLYEFLPYNYSIMNMEGVFSGCSSLDAVEFPNWNTSSVTNMKSLFAGCSALRWLDLSSFDTRSVLEASEMFEGCTSLQEIMVGKYYSMRRVPFPKQTSRSGWWSESTRTWFTAEEIMGNRSGVADTYHNANEPIDISITSVVLDSKTYVYTGKEIKPIVTVSDGSLTLEEGLDYRLSYCDNTNAGTASVIVEGWGNYEGTTSATFTISPANIATATVSSLDGKTYTGTAQTSKPVVKFGSVTLREGADYTLSYKNNVKVGNATVTISGKGNFTGTKNATFKIVATPHVAYRTHVQKVGWQPYVRDGAMSGTSGRSLRLEGINIKLEGAPYAGSIEYRTHVQRIGWQDYVRDGKMAGTSGRSLRLEAIQIRLTGEMAKHYDVYYRVHCQKLGWMGWAKNGTMSGSAGFSYRLEGIEIRLVEKGGKAPGSTSNAFATKTGSQSGVPDAESLVLYSTHVQNVGWQPFMRDGESAGTSGRSLRLEGIRIKLPNAPYSGGIRYKTHIQKLGWESWCHDGVISGTSGRSLRLEAIRIELTGEMANHYDVYYRVHAQKFGWMGWAANGSDAGTAGYSYRLEAIQIRLVPKDGPAPGSMDDAFVERVAPTPGPGDSGSDGPGSGGGGSVVGDTVLITATGSRYHRLSGCRSTANAHTREVSLSYAQSHGYTPCANCYH